MENNYSVPIYPRKTRRQAEGSFYINLKLLAVFGFLDFFKSPCQPMSSAANGAVRKSRRISRACDFCHRRSIRCRPSTGPDVTGKCKNCAAFGEACTYDRPLRKRGAKPKNSQLESTTPRCSSSSASNLDRLLASAEHNVSPRPALWSPSPDIQQAIVVDLIDVYFEVVYPIFPLFHRATLLRKVSRGEYLTSRSLFASVMAACALASARVRDGAVYSDHWDLATLRKPASETFYQASSDAIPDDISAARDLNYLRAYALLALTDIQYGQIRSMHHNLGLYHSLVAMDGLHDEANWPEGLGIVEREERRRLFWSIYTLEVYSSVVWNGIIRCREAQSAVSYPTEADDDSFSDRGFQQSPETPGFPDSLLVSTTPVTWLRGWNFTTDLYRILEHAVDHFRRKRPRHHWQPSLIENIFGDTQTSEADVLQNIVTMYNKLPPEFKTTAPPTTDRSNDRYSFQAANIEVTIQLVQIVLFTSKNATIEQKCRTADDFIRRLSTVPVAYLRAISSPLLHHLAGIGSILGSVFEDRLSERDYLRVRTVLNSMIDILARLEEGLFFPAGASERLKTNVTKIDEYMQNCRRACASNDDNNNSAYMHADIIHSNTTIPDNINAQSLNQIVQRQVEPSALETFTGSPGDYPQFQLPPDLLEDWRWTFDFTQFGTSDIP